LPVNQTHGDALTVAGQWRIFTAFPSILLHFLIVVAAGENNVPTENLPVNDVCRKLFL
jgi:hypothetical protein